jgi:NADH-quinone oxidoreductase subunit L
VSSIGAATAIFAASIGLVQTDIKRVLAYSTVSQLGYMFMACGAAAYAAGIFHLMTHAFFKALLFLGAGSVIHGTGLQDIRKMGGLRRHMPWTFGTFLAGTLAIAGIPFLAGFFSKDMILWSTWNGPNYGRVFWSVGLVTAGFTSFYMFRLLILTFFGEARYTHEEVHHVHESPRSMLVPLVILAILSMLAGYVGVPALLGGANRIDAFLASPADVRSLEEGATLMEWALMLLSIGVAFAGAALAYLFYVARPEWPARAAQRAHAMYTILTNKYYIDEIYDAVIVGPVVAAAREFFWQFMDAFMIDGAVNGAGRLVRATAGGLRQMQSGYVRTYAGWILLGGVLVVVWFLR